MKYILLFLLPLITFILVYPIIPEATYYIYSKAPHTYSFSAESVGTNELIIPKIDVNSLIIEGNNESALSKGAWHLPSTGSPISGNMVIGGHRFAYLPPNNTTFYNLDKLKNGDIIYVRWEGKLYEYRVIESTVVNPTDLSVEDITSKPTLTLFTCTPLWTSSMRLVIKAALAKSFHLQ